MGKSPSPDGRAANFKLLCGAYLGSFYPFESVGWLVGRSVGRHWPRQVKPVNAREPRARSQIRLCAGRSVGRCGAREEQLHSLTMMIIVFYQYTARGQRASAHKYIDAGERNSQASEIFLICLWWLLFFQRAARRSRTVGEVWAVGAVGVFFSFSPRSFRIRRPRRFFTSSLLARLLDVRPPSIFLSPQHLTHSCQAPEKRDPRPVGRPLCRTIGQFAAAISRPPLMCWETREKCGNFSGASQMIFLLSEPKTPAAACGDARRDKTARGAFDPL